MEKYRKLQIYVEETVIGLPNQIGTIECIQVIITKYIIAIDIEDL